MGRRILRRHIWDYAVCLCPIKGTPGLYELTHLDFLLYGQRPVHVLTILYLFFRSVEKDSYDHITATYYLMAERKLRRQRQEVLNAAAMSHLRKNSAPVAKPHLEPLALSPRYVLLSMGYLCAVRFFFSSDDLSFYHSR